LHRARGRVDAHPHRHVRVQGHDDPQVQNLTNFTECFGV
jgi:hypothetical protein